MTQKGSKTLLLPEPMDPIELLPSATSAERNAVLEAQVQSLTERLNALIEVVMESHAQAWGDTHELESVTVAANTTAIAAISTDTFLLPMMIAGAFTVSGGPVWTGITIKYGATEYIVANDSTGSTSDIIVWNPARNSGLAFTAYNLESTYTPQVGDWVMAWFDGTNVWPAVQAPVMHAGLLKANSVTATEISTTTISVSSLTNDSDWDGTLDTIEDGLLLSQKGITLNPASNYDSYIRSGQTDFDTGTGYWIGMKAGPPKLPKLSIGNSSGVKFVFDGAGIKLTGSVIVSAASGGRVEIFPDATTGIACWNNAGTPAKVFEVLVTGDHAGDVTLGDYANNNGCKWDQVLETFDIRGTLNAADIDAGSLTLDGITIDVTAGTATIGNSLLTGDGSGNVYVGSTASYGVTYSVEFGKDANGVGYWQQRIWSSTWYTTTQAVSDDADQCGVLIRSDTTSTPEVYACIGHAEAVVGNSLGIRSVNGGLGGGFPDFDLSGSTLQSFDCCLFTAASPTDNASSRPGYDVILGIDATERAIIDWSDGGKLKVNAEAITGGTAVFSGSFSIENGDLVTVVNGIIVTVTTP